MIRSEKLCKVYRVKEKKGFLKPSAVKEVVAARDVSLTIPVSNGRAVLGTWQGIYLFEHRARAHRRNVVLHLSGD